MTGYLLSILGIVITGVLIDVVVPSGVISKYIKGVYSIFVVAIIISPVAKFLNSNHDFKLNYEQYVADISFLEHIYNLKKEDLENQLETMLENEGFANVDIILTFSIENNELNYNFCKVNLKNLVISSDKQHINKYEFIKNLVKETTNLTDEEIIFDE